MDRLGSNMESIQILSDLHLEAPDAYDTFEITPRAPYLALLGDIGNAGRENHRKPMLDFLRIQLRAFKAVYFVPGNHESYHSNWKETLAVLREFETETAEKCLVDPKQGRFVLMDRVSIRIPSSGGSSPSENDILLVGCSLFSKVPRQRMALVQMALNDFLLSGKDWTVNAHNAAHERDLAWLNEQVALAEQDASVKNIVILTHWSPSIDRRAVEPQHADSPIASAFSTDLSDQVCWTSPKVRAWACGHTHYNFDFDVDRGHDRPSIRLLTNQQGYQFEPSEGFDGEKVLELDL